MGAFFGSVYTRGVDPATVQSVLAKVAKRLGCCFLMAPEIDGWIGIYPSNDQDATVARHIHQHLKADVLQVILHDSDVFCYQYHRDGKLVDEFNSRPDYFEEATARKRQTLRSKPETLATLLRHPDDLDRLRELLRPEDPEDLSDGDAILEGFAKLLGLPGCNTSYGYLMQEADDGEEMERRDEFIHVPDLSAQQGQRAAARAAASAELDRFGREGLLLFDQSPAPRPPCPDPRGQGFLIWDADTWDGDREVHRVSEPWSGGLAPAGIVVERGSSVAVSPSGRYFVLSSSSGSTLLDAATNSSLLNVSGAFAGFTPDENVMITLGQGVRLFSIPDGELIRTIGVNPCNGVYALHPSGSVLLAAGDLKTLSAVSLEDGKVIRSFFIDNPQEFGLTEKLQMAFMEGAREKHIAEGARRTSERTGLPGDTGLPISAEGSRHLRFSADGRLLFCATIHGAWVFDWEALLASPERSPRARYHYQSSTETPSGWWELYLGDSLGRQVFSLDHDPVNNRLLMACGDGNVRQIDLATGEASVLLAMPDLVPVCHVGLSPGGGLLCTIESSAFKKMQLEMEALMGGDRSAASVEKETPPVLRIWDYRKLSG